MTVTPPPRSVLRAALAAAFPALAGSAMLAVAPAAPLAAQEQPEGFSLPPATPAPSPAPAGPADERAGVAIPPRSQPDPVPAVTATPVIQPLPAPRGEPSAAPAPPRKAAPQARASAPSTTAASPAVTAIPPASVVGEAPASASASVPAAPATGAASPLANAPAAPAEAADSPAWPSALFPPAWWPYIAGGLGALALLGGGALLWRRRRPRILRLAAPSAAKGASAGAGSDAGMASEALRLDLTLEITDATRSVMMFTLGYRLTIANRSDRAVNDLNAAVQLACARAGGGSGPSAGAAQALETIARIGPHQARSLTGTVQLPLSAIQPLRQGTTPLFIPLVHVTFEGEGQPATTRSFVVGSRSASGRVHPIPLDQPPGGITGLVAQAVAIPAADAAA